MTEVEAKPAFIPVNEPDLSGNEKAYLDQCIETGWISSEGPFVKAFEEGVAARLSRRHGIAVCNGTVALDVALAALGIGAGDEVILPSFTIISCAAAIVRCGAIPIAVDSDPLTWNMRVDLVEQAITPRTKAVMAVHIYGLPVDMEALQAVTRRHGLLLIEDAAEAIGQTCNGQPCGSFGDVSTLSFYPNKHITTGEGGMVLADDEGVARRASRLRNLCFGKEHRFRHEELGWNFRMTNLQAAVGVAQLEKLDATIRKKRQIGGWYEALFDGVHQVQRLPAKTSYADNIWWVYGLVLDDAAPFDAAEAMRRLAEVGIGTRPFFWPMHEQPVLNEMGFFKGVSCPVASRLARRGFYLPSGVTLTSDQASRVAAAVIGLFQ